MGNTDLVIILVIYKKKFKEIPALSFIEDLHLKAELKLHLVIYDNSPEVINDASELPANISYVHDKNNPGLAVAYNYGLDVCNKRKCEWLLLLDHDTELTEDYFAKVFELFRRNILTPEVVAIMPIVKANDITIAPVKRELILYHTPLNKTGLLTGNISGINSCTIIRVSFMNELGGFNLKFPLDYLDHWFFNEITKAAKYIYVLDTVIRQNLSIINAKIDPIRYRSLLRARVLFYSDKSTLFALRLKLSLVKKLIKHLLLTKDKQYARITFKYLIESFKSTLTLFT